MKIAAVEIKDHPGIGSLSLDFRGYNNKASKIVVLAGENGSGKTVILDAIFNALAPSPLLMGRTRPPGRYRVLLEPEKDITSAAFRYPIDPDLFDDIRRCYADFDGIVVESHPPGSLRWPHQRFTRMSDNMSTGLHPGDTAEYLASDRACFFSEANVSFNVPPISSVTTSAGRDRQPNLPAERKFPLRGGAALAGEIAQLFVDLQAADDTGIARWVRENASVPDDTVLSGRIGRFKEAFKRVVPNKIYDRVDVSNGQLRAVFKDGPFELSLADLSTGEKQIIFRGAFLLKQDSLNGSVIMIDEPELSLHPLWQASIIPFYERILSQSDDESGQIIVATHSPFVVHGTPTAKHIVMRRDPESRQVRVDHSSSYPGATPADLAITAFDLTAFPEGKRVALVVEGKTDKELLEVAWGKLNGSIPMNFIILPAGGARPVQQLLGTEPANSGPLLTALSSTSVDAIIGLFDFDNEGWAQWNGSVKTTHASSYESNIGKGAYRRRVNTSVWSALLPVPSYRETYASLEADQVGQSRLTIELLFEDIYVEQLLTRKKILGTSDTFLFASDPQKANVVVAARDFPPGAFDAFQRIFDLVERVLQSL